MDSTDIQNHFYSFYGASVAPFDLTILASSTPELLILIDFITQYEGAKISRSANIEKILKTVPATPDGLAEAFAAYLVPLSEKYKLGFKKTPALAHFDQIFTILQINIIIRIACCLCITIIKHGDMSEDLLNKMNEFSGLIGLFRNSHRGPLQTPKAIITEVESSVSLTISDGSVPAPEAAANNSMEMAMAMTRRNKGGARRKFKRTRRQLQRGGGRFLMTLLSILGLVPVIPDPTQTPPPIAPGSFRFNPNTGAFNGGLPFGNAPNTTGTFVSAGMIPATNRAAGASPLLLGAINGATVAANGSASAAGGSASAAGGSAARNNSGSFIVNAGPGFNGWTDSANSTIVGAVNSTFEILLANTANITANLPYNVSHHEKTPWMLEYVTKLAAKNFNELKFPAVSSSAFNVTTAAGNHTVLDIFNLPPEPGLDIHVIGLEDIGRSLMAINGLYYLGNHLPEISFITTSHTTHEITNRTGVTVFHGVGVANNSVFVGTRATTEINTVLGKNVLGTCHTHPVVFDRVNSFGSIMDWNGFVRRAILGQGTLNIIGTQTGLLVYTFHPEILKALENQKKPDRWEELAESITAAGFRGRDIPLFQDSNNTIVNSFQTGFAPGRYKVVAPCANSTRTGMYNAPNVGCASRLLDLQVYGTPMSIPYLFDVAFIPYQLVLRGLANIPIYSKTLVPHPFFGRHRDAPPPGTLLWMNPVPSSRGLTMSAIAGVTPLALQYRQSNNIVLPNIPPLFSLNISCFRPESVLRGLHNYQYQQRCLFQLSRPLRFAKDPSFDHVVRLGPHKLGEQSASTTDIMAIIAPGLEAIQAAFAAPEVLK